MDERRNCGPTERDLAPAGGLLDLAKLNGSEITRLDLQVAGLKKELTESKAYAEALRATVRVLLDELPLTGDASMKAARERAERVLGGSLS